MTRLRIPVVLILFGSACSLFVPEDDYFGGEGGGGSGAASGGHASGGKGSGGNASGATGGSGSDPTAGGGATSAGGRDGEAGAMNGGAGGSSGGGAGGSSGEPGTSGGGAGGVSGAAGAAGAAGVAGAAAACGLPATKAMNEPCGACNTGMRTRSFTLTEACDYVEVGLTECTGVTAACSPGQTIACANGDSCGQRVCSGSCVYGGCEPRVAGGCLRIREGHTDEGSNYRCCGSGGRWQFCLSSCQWSASCVACSQGAPDYCTECY